MEFSLRSWPSAARFAVLAPTNCAPTSALTAASSSPASRTATTKSSASDIVHSFSLVWRQIPAWGLIPNRRVSGINKGVARHDADERNRDLAARAVKHELGDRPNERIEPVGRSTLGSIE